MATFSTDVGSPLSLTHCLGDTSGAFLCGGESQSRGLPLHWVVFAEACLVSVRRNCAHRTLATALGFVRCRHINGVLSPLS